MEPQRIEQRIGRCHRYGQQHDVVVVNFGPQQPADKRVYELLAQNFSSLKACLVPATKCWAPSAAAWFERRIAEIYQTCRNPQEIEASFQQLQLDLSGEISAAMLKTRQLLLENFDEAARQAEGAADRKHQRPQPVRAAADGPDPGRAGPRRV